MSLLPYQTAPAEELDKILREYGAALDASDTGTGKTYVAINVAKRLGLPVGIVCPKSVIPSWIAVCAAEGLIPSFVLNYELLTRGGTEWLKRDGKEYCWNFQGLVIWDEVHRCRSTASLNAKMLIAAWRTRTIRCLMLSATAAQNPLEMRALGYVLGLHKGHDFWPWVMRLGAKKNRWGGFSWNGSQTTLSAIHSQIFPSKGVRVRIKDLGQAFPENLTIPEIVEVDNGESLKAYQEAHEELERLRKISMLDYPSVFTIQLRARQKTEILKVPLIVERTRELVDEGKSVVIFCNFNATLEQLAKELDTDCVIRQQPPDERATNIKRFSEDERRICIANIQAGGVGVSLHDLRGVFPRVAFICPTFNAVDLRQALGRIHRAGGRSPSVQYVLYAAGTIEERVAKSVKAKLDNLDLLNDDDLSDGITLSQ